ncbi:Uncharacterised protein [Mycobacterium tuberculosis]|nr:Uncharacterised protein [Mycobacterium tuberculosis]
MVLIAVLTTSVALSGVTFRSQVAALVIREVDLITLTIANPRHVAGRIVRIVDLTRAGREVGSDALAKLQQLALGVIAVDALGS